MSNTYCDRCRVCDDVAIGINFGVPTCMACKAFFRRNALKLGIHEFKCKEDGYCIITYKYRRSCNCCRLAKCFQVGMQKSLILSDEDREARNKLVQVNRLKRGKVSSRQSAMWLQAPSLLRISSNSFKSLAASDQTVLANIFDAYASTCIVAKATRYTNFPLNARASVHEFVNDLSEIFQIIVDYLKCIPHFRQITMNDKVRLLKNHMGLIININEPIMYSIPSENLVKSWFNVFGCGIAQAIQKRYQVAQQYTRDPIILKLVLIIVVLSSSNGRNIDDFNFELCDDTLSIFAAQNVYVELLWKYILSRSTNEKEAVKYLNQLIMFVLYVQELDMSINNYIMKLTSEIEQMEPLMKNMWPDKNDTKITSD